MPFLFQASDGFVADLSVTSLQSLTRAALNSEGESGSRAENRSIADTQTERSVSHPMIRIDRKSQGTWACSRVAGHQKKVALGHCHQSGGGRALLGQLRVPRCAV